MYKSRVKDPRHKISSVAEFLDLLQGARGTQKLRFFAPAYAVSALSYSAIISSIAVM